jgi:hypothetical protein
MSQPRPDRSRPPRPIPAREADPRPPQPVEAAEPAPSPAPEPGPAPVEEVEVEADGERWTVRVGGRGRTGAATAAVPLLLLTFRRDGGGDAALESMVVGRALGDLTDDDLRAALRRGRRPPEPGTRKEIFPEVGGRNRGREG